jgi:hypothetical protein
VCTVGLCFVVLPERMMLPGVVRTEYVYKYILGQVFLRCDGSIDNGAGFMVLRVYGSCHTHTLTSNQ